MRKRKDFIQGYRDALARLIRNEGTVITGSYKINFDTVALEANRKRGAIKGNTEEIVALKQDILEAERKRNKKNLNSGMDTRELIRSKDLKYKELMIKNERLEIEIESLGRQLASVIYQLALTKKEILENKDVIEFVKK